MKFIAKTYIFLETLKMSSYRIFF